MTTPTDNTPLVIITDAMLDAGLIKLGQIPSSEQLATGLRKLGDLVNYMQTQGLKLWLNYDLSITLVAGTALYKLGPAAAGAQWI